MSTIDELLKDFDAADADYHGIAVAGGTVAAVEDAIGRFLDSMWPVVQPYVDAGLDFAAIAAGTYAGPLAPLVTYVADAFGKVGLDHLVKWLTAKLRS